MEQQQTIDITTLSVDELKGLGFDLGEQVANLTNQANQAQNNLNLVRQEIQRKQSVAAQAAADAETADAVAEAEKLKNAPATAAPAETATPAAAEAPAAA